MNSRIDTIERELYKLMQAPTVPIYDPANMPEDAVEGQVAIGTDNSLNWYCNGHWYTQAGSPSITGSVPQDAVDGQTAIGSDGSFHWFIRGTWYSAEFTDSITGSVPQDTVVGQIAIGTDGTFHWYS